MQIVVLLAACGRIEFAELELDDSGIPAETPRLISAAGQGNAGGADLVLAFLDGTGTPVAMHHLAGSGGVEGSSAASRSTRRAVAPAWRSRSMVRSKPQVPR